MDMDKIAQSCWLLYLVVALLHVQLRSPVQKKKRDTTDGASRPAHTRFCTVSFRYTLSFWNCLVLSLRIA